MMMGVPLSVAFLLLLTFSFDSNIPIEAASTARSYLQASLKENLPAWMEVQGLTADSVDISVGIPVYIIGNEKIESFLESDESDLLSKAERRFAFPVMLNEFCVGFVTVRQTQPGYKGAEVEFGSCDVCRAERYRIQDPLERNNKLAILKTPVDSVILLSNDEKALNVLFDDGTLTRVANMLPSWKLQMREIQLTLYGMIINAPFPPESRFSPTPSRARYSDVIVVGTLTNHRVREIAVKRTSSGAFISNWVVYYDTGTIEIEDIIKGDGITNVLHICFPSERRPYEELGHGDPPDVKEGDRRIWLLQDRIIPAIPSYYLPGNACVIPLEMMDKVLKYGSLAH
jgi:hypothetical protein